MATSRRPVSARPRAHSSPIARSPPSPAARRKARTRGWPDPGPPVRHPAGAAPSRTIRSAPTAERSAPIPARKAITSAEGRRSRTRPGARSGSAGHVSRSGSAPNRPANVAISGKWAARPEPSASARISPNQRSAALRRTTISAIFASPTATEPQTKPSPARPRAPESAPETPPTPVRDPSREGP